MIRCVLPIDGRLGVVARSVGELLDDLAVVFGQINIEVRIHRPQVALAAIRLRRAGRADPSCVDAYKMCLLSARKYPHVVTPLPRRHQVLVRSVRVHDVLLIAVVAIACRLEDEPFSIRSPVRFRVLPSMRQLPQIVEPDLGNWVPAGLGPSLREQSNPLQAQRVRRKLTSS